MLNNNYICALELGSSKISAVLAKVNKRRIDNLFFDYVLSKGIKRGVIFNSTDTLGCISKVINNLKEKSGINIKSLYANISGREIVKRNSHAVLPLAERGNKVITIQDVHRINEQARILGSNLEDEIIHMIPLVYAIDSRSNLINPVGLYSHSLGVDVLLLAAKLSSVQNITRLIDKCGCEVKELFYSSLIESNAVLNTDLKQGNVLFCDTGADKTELLMFKDGNLNDLLILDIGGNILTDALKSQLDLPYELAEDIKRSYGIIGDCAKIPEDKEILVKKGNFYKPIKQRMVSQIITFCAKNMCSNIKAAIEEKVRIVDYNSIIVAGRTVLLEGFIETLENTLTVPVKLARIHDPQMLFYIKEENILTSGKYLTYLTPLGIISKVHQEKSGRDFLFKYPARNLIQKAVNKVRGVYQEYF